MEVSRENLVWTSLLKVPDETWRSRRHRGDDDDDDDNDKVRTLIRAVSGTQSSDLLLAADAFW